ncbi:MAG TPA: 5,6-dimethylbenzimidazole synthase [Acetobacteraceae bacterium]
MTSGPVFDEEFRANLRDLFKWRRDVRRFRCDPLAPGLLNDLIEAANSAPSVGLSQPWRFVTVDDPVRRAAIRKNFAASNAAALAAQPAERAKAYAGLKLAGLDDAPCHLALFTVTDPVQGSMLGRSTMPETLSYSAVIAVHTLWLAARAAGAGLGWVSIVDPVQVHAILDVPVDWAFTGYFCLGYPQNDQDAPELEREGWERRQAPAVLPR